MRIFQPNFNRVLTSEIRQQDQSVETSAAAGLSSCREEAFRRVIQDEEFQTALEYSSGMNKMEHERHLYAYRN